VKDIANQVGPMFGITSIGGWRASSVDMTGHPAGLALDMQVGSDRAKGDKLAGYLTQNASALNIKYVLWRQRSWYPGKGWQSMDFRSGDAPGYDPNHLRHVHVSFNSKGSSGGAGVVPAFNVANIIDGIPNPFDIQNPLDAVGLLFEVNTWKRVGLVVGGAGTILVGIAILVLSSGVAGKAGALMTLVPNPATKVAGAAIAATDGGSS
jgi:hypothetical protein